MKTALRAGMLLAVFFLTAACAGLFQWAAHKPVDEQRTAELNEARKLLATLEERNRNLQTFKGIGRLKLRQAGNVLSIRLAWIGSYPDKLRITVMNVVGQPTASLATDGRFLYMVSHSKREFYNISFDYCYIRFLYIK